MSDGEREAWLQMEMRYAGVPDEYRTATWEKCRVEQPLKEYCRFIRQHRNDGAGLICVGPVGTGKSCSATLIVKTAIANGMTAKWVYVPDLVDTLADRYRRAAAVRQNVTPDFVVWDDFGVGGLADWQIGLLDRIVEKRYVVRKPMIVTTNLTKEDLAGSVDAARMVDRWRHRGRLLTIAGTSQRAE